MDYIDRGGLLCDEQMLVAGSIVAFDFSRVF
ncbi:MAG: hypothetical protein ACI8XZ_001852 [Gammaproteobacteria bacterium]|jgi:hypothetical protein